jgi:hypothetical protein
MSISLTLLVGGLLANILAPWQVPLIEFPLSGTGVTGDGRLSLPFPVLSLLSFSCELGVFAASLLGAGVNVWAKPGIRVCFCVGTGVEDSPLEGGAPAVSFFLKNPRIDCWLLGPDCERLGIDFLEDKETGEDCVALTIIVELKWVTTHPQLVLPLLREDTDRQYLGRQMCLSTRRA